MKIIGARRLLLYHKPFLILVSFKILILAKQNCIETNVYGSPLRIENCSCLLLITPLTARKNKSRKTSQGIKQPHFFSEWLLQDGDISSCIAILVWRKAQPSNTRLLRDSNKAKCLRKDAQNADRLWIQLSWINDKRSIALKGHKCQEGPTRQVNEWCFLEFFFFSRKHLVAEDREFPTLGG